MSIKKFRPLSPDPYINKTKGDTEFARLAHLNSLVDQTNAEITQTIANKNYKEYVAKLTQAPNQSLIETLIQDDFATGGIVWSNPSTGVFKGTPLNDVFDSSSSYIFTIQDVNFSPIVIVYGKIELDNTIVFIITDLQEVAQNGAWGTRTFSLKVYN